MNLYDMIAILGMMVMGCFMFYIMYKLDTAKDKPTSIRAGEVTVAAGYKCKSCGLIRPFNMPECICKPKKQESNCEKLWDLWREGLHMADGDCAYVKAEQFDAFLSRMERILTEIEQS